jgi:hypothetical protein
MGLLENRSRLTDANGTELIVPERTTLRITGILTDETGAPIPSAALTTLTLTLYAPEVTGQPIINGVTGENVLNDGVRGTVHATNGTVTLTLLPADGAIQDATREFELHRALLQWTYGSGGAKAGKQEIDYLLRNLSQVS